MKFKRSCRPIPSPTTQTSKNLGPGIWGFLRKVVQFYFSIYTRKIIFYHELALLYFLLL